jgi:hypothetical protein
MMHHHAMVRVVNDALWGPSANDETHGDTRGTILEAMRHWRSGCPSDGVPCAEGCLLFFDENEFPGDQEGKLILRLMPMTMGGPRPWRKLFEANPELCETDLVAKNEFGIGAVVLSG